MRNLALLPEGAAVVLDTVERRAPLYYCASNQAGAASSRAGASTGAAAAMSTHWSSTLDAVAKLCTDVIGHVPNGARDIQARFASLAHGVTGGTGTGTGTAAAHSHFLHDTSGRPAVPSPRDDDNTQGDEASVQLWRSWWDAQQKGP